MTQSRRSILTLLLLLYLAGVLGCKKKKKEEEWLRPVKYQKVQLILPTQIKSFSGVAKAGKEINLSFKVAGTIEMLPVKVGQRVKANELIATLDATDFILRYEQATASMKDAEAQRQNSKANFQRTKRLYENDNASLNDYESALAEYESSEARVSSFKKQKELTEAQLSYTSLLTPISGVIAEKRVEINENVVVGQVIVVLNSGTDMELDFMVPDIYISRVALGSQVKVEFASIPFKKYLGRITEIGFSAERRSSTYPVTLVILDADEYVRPGMAAEVYLELKKEGGEKGIVVPVSAVGEDNKGNFVYIIHKENTKKQEIGVLEKRYVKVGEIKPDGLMIQEGLVEGDLIVTGGVSKVNDGLKVRLLD
ncbi:efflux RND transporter periplasmic adaptor subunit [Xanthovirga aplysinae]|uniref:efflux RND transporter periplasmic adaptor subunit n=1 Tax=Xanthovirga aplysinae TaxID=2529853 RepID=UPI0012BC5D8C|nr:efflux RND transporter periplasmic adaptor subunit [Xanthovirga aplysinae]MTI33178.1 efflux RND transporter periplasmic adaptor subunit [Xanthovirga aplysinae]